MKYLIIGCCILAVLLAVCILSGFWIDNTTSYTQELLRKAENAALSGDAAEASKCAQHAQKHWQEQQGILASILCHDEIDEITEIFSQLVVCDPVGDMLEFRMHCAQLLSCIKSIADMGQPLLPNIL